MKRISIALLISILFLLLSTAVGLGFIHITNIPYVIDIDALSIPEASGLERQEIMMNYNAVLDYLSPFCQEDFSLPTLKFTETGAGHFHDCKVIFNWIYALGAAAALGLILMKAFKLFDRRTLRLSGILTAAIPVLLLAATALNFDKLFLYFHKVFFEDNTWIFDPRYDEIIKILPQTFFMHCALLIFAFWLIAAGEQLYLSRKTRPTLS